MIRRLLPRAVIIALVLAFVVAGLGGSRVEMLSRRTGGDFPAFYGAGRVVLDGNQAELYDPAAQAEAQSNLFPEPGGYLYFAYPPYTAIPYVGLAALPYRLAFMLHGLLSMAALWCAVRLARPMLPRLLRSRGDELVALATLLATYPILRSVAGGQNTAFTLLLIVVVWRAAEDHRPAVAGLALAGLLYKPQYGLLLMLVVLAARRFRILAWWTGGAIVAYSLGALMLGAAWPSLWLHQVSSFNDENLRVNGHLMVSAMGWFASLASSDVVGIGVGLAVAALAGALAVRTVWRLDISATSMAVVLPAIVIASPSALFYDSGLAVGTIGVGVDRGGREMHSTAFIAVAASWTQPAAAVLGWSPLFPWLLGLLGWALVFLVREQLENRAQ